MELTYTVEEDTVALEDMVSYDVFIVRAHRADSPNSVGYVTLNRENREALELYVSTDYRRQGIATRLWAYAREHYDAQHSTDRTVDGQAWALSLGVELPRWVRM